MSYWGGSFTGRKRFLHASTWIKEEEWGRAQEDFTVVSYHPIGKVMSRARGFCRKKRV